MRVDRLDKVIWWIRIRCPHCTVRKPVVLDKRVGQLVMQAEDLYDVSKHGKKQTN